MTGIDRNGQMFVYIPLKRYIAAGQTTQINQIQYPYGSLLSPFVNFFMGGDIFESTPVTCCSYARK